MNRTPKLSAYLAAASVLALAAAACSSGGGAQQEDTGANAEAGDLTIAMITHEVPGDTFWDRIRAGAEDSAANHGITLDYNSDPSASEQATLVRTAIDKGVDGIAVTLAKPAELQGAVQEAEDAGIPVVAFNSGIEEWQDMGVTEYFGTDESLAGEAFGERLNEAGAEKALCVIQEQGHVALETRCSSLEEAFDGDTETLYVDGSSMPDVKSSITSKLQSDEDIDHVVTLGGPFAMAALDSVSDAGSDAKVATFDLNKEVVAAIEDGTIEWAVDQQPYLQGYLSVEGLWLINANGNDIGGGTEPVLTGPSFVDADNVGEVAEFAEKGTR
ncbi:substrate-binding domain-containing protein [Nocardiopsis suaedae]|uniref:Substrate-binding domain-containing protein n=1 Tax=Nocardiopsis suaedae TaxID=3018444 RepID=A0ABT4TPE9_9ACTN|nr:substrate-binding domain-containing protein [Nocardiopsis suaedae]MDA2806271.1 substrate-binding domain-containing protein [Nocardiopsis suaedae]